MAASRWVLALVAMVALAACTTTVPTPPPRTPIPIEAEVRPSSVPTIDPASCANGPWWAWPCGVTSCGGLAVYRIDGGEPRLLGGCSGRFHDPPDAAIVRVGQMIELHMITNAPVGASPGLPLFPLPPSPNERLLHLVASTDGGATGGYLALGPGNVVLDTSGCPPDWQTLLGACPVLGITIRA
jgi:hypothetical protein